MQPARSSAGAFSCAPKDAPLVPTHLRVELDVGRAEADEAREQRLVQVTVLLYRHVLDHGGQLVVVPDQDDALQPVVTVLLALQGAGQGRAWSTRRLGTLQDARSAAYRQPPRCC